MNRMAPYLMSLLTSFFAVEPPNVQCISKNENRLNNNLKTSVFHANIRSLNKNFDEQEQIRNGKNDKSTAKRLSETWLPSDYLVNINKLSGYNMVISESTKICHLY